MTTGYTFQTEFEAQEAINDCNIYYNIPAGPDDVTQNVADYMYSEYDEFYYIIYDPLLEVVLGEPEVFEITIESGLPTDF